MGIVDHNPKNKNITARILKCDVKQVPTRTTATGECYYYLTARAYVKRSAESEKLISSIESGELNEVSIGCAVSAIEGGRVKPSAKTIEKIATALHVPVESITNEQPKPDPTFTPYQVMLIYKAIQHRIDEEINRLADGMQVDKSEVLRVWEEHKND